MDEFFDANRRLWDGLTRLHRDSAFYDVAGFKAGGTSLREVELAEMGDVAGKSLLHLQCHFGLDTLSWARRGARVVGVDLSETAIAEARGLSEELSIPAEFIACNVYDLPERLDRRFDLVYTSYGVIRWLPDLARWARLVARFLKPGGVFYMVEFHPLASMLDDHGRMAHAYFHEHAPERWEESGSYAAPDAEFRHESYEWAHSLGETVSALLDAGLKLDMLREHPFSAYDCFPNLVRQSPQRWTFQSPDWPGPGAPPAAPLMFSLRARKLN